MYIYIYTHTYLGMPCYDTRFSFLVLFSPNETRIHLLLVKVTHLSGPIGASLYYVISYTIMCVYIYIYIYIHDITTHYDIICMLCYIIQHACYVMLCYDMLHYIMLYHIMLLVLVFRTLDAYLLYMLRCYRVISL